VKYVLMLVRSDERWEAMSDEERDYGAIDHWFGELAQRGLLAGGEELQAARTATTVSWDGARPVLTDGPFMEAKETIGGFAVVDAPDLDAAIRIASTWPARSHRVEIRPIAIRSIVQH
jgi:hypothetical protein